MRKAANLSRADYDVISLLNDITFTDIHYHWIYRPADINFFFNQKQQKQLQTLKEQGRGVLS